jgi:alcohol dehydrogenase (cytochrome c)
MNPNQTPTPEGNLVCPAVEGATNFFSTSYNPATGWYYVQTLEKCAVYTKRPTPDWRAGRGYRGGGGRMTPEPKPQKILRAIDINTGKAVWELPQVGPANTWGGVLSTASGLVFFGEDGGALMAADASSGKPLWDYQLNQSWKSSPMTYAFDGKQYLAIAAGGNIVAFGVIE